MKRFFLFVILALMPLVATSSDEVADSELKKEAPPPPPSMAEIGGKAYGEAFTSLRCKFDFFIKDDVQGRLLADDARKECAENAGWTAMGKVDSVSDKAYTRWRDYHFMEILRRILQNQ